MSFGLVHHVAPPLRVKQWIDAGGQDIAPLCLSDLGTAYRILYCFQDWCAGCHSTGFPTLQYLHSKLTGRGFGFAVIQTVFEGKDVNTFDKLRVNQQRYQLDIPFGHDTPPEGKWYPTFMEDYRTQGTPWFTIIDPEDNVVYADFLLNPQRFLELFGVSER
jgi:hypothetical protein